MIYGSGNAGVELAIAWLVTLVCALLIGYCMRRSHEEIASIKRKAAKRRLAAYFIEQLKENPGFDRSLIADLDMLLVDDEVKR